MIQSHRLRRKLDAREPATGAIVNVHAPWFIDLLGISGFDFVMLDAEHGPITPENVEPMIRAAEQAGMSALVRVPGNVPHIILGFLDAGAQAIQVPHVQTADDARRAVSAVRYPPAGARGMSMMTRAAHHGFGPAAAEYVEAANREIVLVPMIETMEGVENVDAILDVAGVDALFIGTGDLAASVGLPGQRNAPEVRDAIRHVLARAAARGVPVGLPVSDVASAADARAAGVAFLEVAMTNLLVRTGRDFLEAIA